MLAVLIAVDKLAAINIWQGFPGFRLACFQFWTLRLNTENPFN